MLEAPDLKGAILALRPLWESTPLLEEKRNPDPNDPSDTQAQIASQGTATERLLSDYYFRIPWVRCPDCFCQWNVLHDGGTCIACFDEAFQREKNQISLGIYLKKTIGIYGIERYSFENYTQDEGNAEAFQSMHEFDYRHHNVFLYGPGGTGKTHLAGSALKASSAKNLAVCWLQPLYVARTLRSKFPSEEEDIIESWVAKDVCIVDDLGVGRDLESTLKMMYELLDKRKARKKNGLIICSNQSLDVLAKAYKDDRVISRIAGMCRVVEISGVDRRLSDRIAP